MAKNPVKGFTMDQIERSTRRAEVDMRKNAEILNKQNPEANGPNYEKIEEFDHAGGDGHDVPVENDDSPLGMYAYVSTAGHFQRLQDNIAAAFTPRSGKTKADKEAEFKGETKKVSKKLKETTSEEYKPFESYSNYFNKTGK